MAKHLVSVLAGAAAMLLLAAVAFMVLNWIFGSGVPLLWTSLTLIISPLLGGAVAGWRATETRLGLGAWSGLVAGSFLMALLAYASGLSPRAMLAGIVICAGWLLLSELGAALVQARNPFRGDPEGI
jgi:hypothetical protein